MLALVVIAAESMHFGCVTSQPEMTRPEMAWVRTDGRRIVDDPALLQQGKTDIAVCHANLDVGTVGEKARECMTRKGYDLVRKDQAEEVRAGYAAQPVQSESLPPATDR
jgi:hypothetical protein